MKLHDKMFLLTGASGGIGFSLASRLFSEGVKLVVTGRNDDAARRLQQRFADAGHAVEAVVLALDSPELSTQARRIADRFPQLDGIINCAGVNGFRDASRLDEAFTRFVLGVNVNAVITLTQALLPGLTQRPEALVVNIGSTFGSIGYPGYSVYCASKFALRGYTEALRRELADTRVKVVYVAPRATRTEMNSRAVNAMNEALKVHADTPDTVAVNIIAAMTANASQWFIGWPEKLFVRINALITGLVDHALIKQLPIIQRYLREENIHAK